jgi:hypothetical protein
MVALRVIVAALVAGLVSGCSVPPAAPEGAAAMPAPVRSGVLACLLQAPEHVGLDQSVVPVTYTLRNEGPADVRVPMRFTPLEGILGDIFTVTLDGRPLEYRGRMVKRGPPGEDEFVTLAPGDHAHATVDLLEGYDLARAGHYTVRFAAADGYTCNTLVFTRD